MLNTEFPYFKTLRFIDNKKEGIAKSMRSTGELVINKYYWKNLKEEHKFYVLAHEEGHILYNTRDELKADQHASERYFLRGFKLSESVKALGEHLDRNNPVHIARTWLQYQRALQYDFEKNNNVKAYRKNYGTAATVIQKLKNYDTTNW